MKKHKNRKNKKQSLKNEIFFKLLVFALTKAASGILTAAARKQAADNGETECVIRGPLKTTVVWKL